jgi:SAM-dependent methyltransferase
MMQAVDNFRDRNYWIVENALYIEPSFRLRKCARVLNKLASNRECTLLDVGCGPAALRPLLNHNINYYGIDIAIHKEAENLREIDVARDRIGFDNKRFDFVVALGFFEYLGNKQRSKFEEIHRILNDGGKFLMSYINFGHFRRKVWPNYNNVQSIAEMTADLSKVFKVEKQFPASHNWRQKQPGRRSLPELQLKVNFNIPFFSRLLAVEYFFLCSQQNERAVGLG